MTKDKAIFFAQSAIWLLFTGFSAYVAGHHERWADEVQALLIAQDAAWLDILTTIPHAEGQPVLWIILLKLLSFGSSGTDILFISVAVMSAAVWLIVFRYPIPLAYKILLPFGHYFLYQYNVVSRNYCLAFLALAVIGLSYTKRHKNIWRYALALIFLAETTTFYAPVAAVLGIAWLYEGYCLTNGQPKAYLAPFCVLSAFGLFLIWQLAPFPAVDFSDLASVSTSVRHLETSNYIIYLFKQLYEAFFSLPLILILYFVLLGILLAKGPVYVWQKVATGSKAAKTGICAFAAFLVPFSLSIPLPYHQGLAFGLFLLLCYISVPYKSLHRVRPFFILLMVLQLARGISVAYFDIKFPVAAQEESAHMIRQHTASDVPVLPVSYNTLPLRLMLNRTRLEHFGNNPRFHRWNRPAETSDKAHSGNILVFGADRYEEMLPLLFSKDFYLYAVSAYMPFPQSGGGLNFSDYILIPAEKYIRQTEKKHFTNKKNHV